MNCKKWFVMVGLLLMALVLLASCSKKEDNTSKEQASDKTEAKQEAAKVDPATAATVSGVVKFSGTAPKPAKIDMSQDPACKGNNVAETVVADNGDLANVFVYVKGIQGSFPPPSDAVKINQDGCRYHPHVIGVMAGQPIQIVNSDATTHNIHPTPKDNPEWNKSQGPKAEPITEKFNREEIMMPVKCNQHPWMKMYINVVKNPFFAVTGKDGKFEIKGLPPGTYTITAVQEKLGSQDMQVTVGPKDSKTVDFSFKEGGQ